MKIMSYTKARNNLRQVLDDVVDSSIETVITSQGEDRDVVVMSLADYNGWATTNYLLGSPANAERLMRSLKDVAAGKVIEGNLLDE